MEREAISKTVKKTRFASLVVDGATDSDVMEQDIVFVRISNDGQVIVSFLGIENTPKSDAVGVTASIVRAVESGLSIDMADFHKKFVAIATDDRPESRSCGPTERQTAISCRNTLCASSRASMSLCDEEPSILPGA